MKKIQLLLLSLLLALSMNGYAQQALYGDVNGDNEVNIADVNAVIGVILNGQPIVDDHDWVDLGLPSGTIWATRNVGANSPEDYGNYFAWGETEPKDYYSMDTYKWFRSDNYSPYYSGYTKYCTDSYLGYNGFTDGKTELDPSDDAACAHYPGGRMPSLEQIQELANSCTWQWTQRNGVNGQLGTGPNGNTIFLPAAGDRWVGSLYFAGTGGYYWSRTFYPDGSDFAYGLFFDSGDVYRYDFRYYGHTVRAVRVSQN